MRGCQRIASRMDAPSQSAKERAHVGSNGQIYRGEGSESRHCFDAVRPRSGPGSGDGNPDGGCQLRLWRSERHSEGEARFVNAQIEKLYGPLYAASQADNEVWKLFTADRWRERDAKDESGAFFDDKNPPTVDQVRRWRHWMRTVFQPLNLRMEEAIVTNSHLLVGNTEPIAFRDLIAHAEAYKAVIAAWDVDDLAKCQQPASRTQATPPCPGVMR